MSVIGIDFGNSNSRVAAAGKGGVDVLLNGISKRDNATLVSFGPKERHIGESGLDLEVRNAQNTVSSVKRFIGMQYGAASLDQEKEFLTCEIAPEDGETRGVNFTLNYDGEHHRFRPEQILAMMLTQLKGISASHLPTAGQGARPSCVLSCPAYYTQNQKQALLHACEIADIQCLGLLNETTAAALDYGIFKIQEFPTDVSKGNGAYVCFIDVGHSATTASIVCFYASEMKVVATCFDENLGSRNIDMLLLHHFRDEIMKKYRFDVFTNKKARIRLMQACQKIKTTLSANPVTSLSLECLHNDIDIHFPKFSRDELETLISGFAAGFEALCQKIVLRFQSIVDKDNSDISHLPVELIGGGSRIPVVKRITQSVFGSPSRTTLNATETVSKGCAIHAAILSPNYRVREYKISDVAVYPAKIGYFSPIAQASNASQRQLYPFLPEEINKIINIIKVGDSLPKALDVSFERDENFDVYTFYEHAKDGELNLSRVLPHQHLLNHSSVTNVSGDISTNEGVISRLNKVKLRFKVSLVGSIDIASAQVITEYERWETKDTVPPSENSSTDAQQEGNQDEVTTTPHEKRTKKDRKTSQAFIERHPLVDTMSADMVIHAKTLEREMCARDLLAQRTAEARNSLETCFYEYRYKIVDQGGELHRFTPEQEIKAFDQMCSEASSWLESDEGFDANLDAYLSRLNPMQPIVDSAVAKMRTFESLPLSMEEFEAKINSHRAKLGQIKGDDAGGWHTQEEISRIDNSLHDLESWYTSAKIDNASQPLYVEPILTTDILLNKFKEHEKRILPLLNKCKPPPPKPEPSAKSEEPEVPSNDSCKETNAPAPEDMEVE